MIKKLLEPLQQLIRDRYLLGIAIAILLLSIGFFLFIGFQIHYSELQIVTHYTAFGVTNFYRDKWYYLLSFIGFGVVVAIMHILLMGKLNSERGRQIALLLGWATIAVILVAWIVTTVIVKVAALT